jgi:hypothetical protein
MNATKPNKPNANAPYQIRKVGAQWFIFGADGNKVSTRDHMPYAFAYAFAASDFCTYWGIFPVTIPELDSQWGHR